VGAAPNLVAGSWTWTTPGRAQGRPSPRPCATGAGVLRQGRRGWCAGKGECAPVLGIATSPPSEIDTAIPRARDPLAPWCLMASLANLAVASMAPRDPWCCPRRPCRRAPACPHPRPLPRAPPHPAFPSTVPLAHRAIPAAPSLDCSVLLDPTRRLFVNLVCCACQAQERADPPFLRPRPTRAHHRLRNPALPYPCPDLPHPHPTVRSAPPRPRPPPPPPNDVRPSPRPCAAGSLSSSFAC
jgi:hypothetical protein